LNGGSISPAWLQGINDLHYFIEILVSPALNRQVSSRDLREHMMHTRFHF